MRSPSATAKTKKQNRIIGIVFGSIIYLFLVYGIFQYMAAKAANPRKGMSDIFTITFENLLNPAAALPLQTKAIPAILIATALGALFLMMKLSTKALKKHDNPDTVNGEARLMTPADIKNYSMRKADPIGKPQYDGPKNMILSKEIMLAIDNKHTRRNCNILAIGGSGAGKSRFFAAPNILQYNANFVITDPSGDLLRDYGKALEDNGYNVKVFNLTDVYRGNRYNPFHYIKEEKDVFVLVNTLIKNTTPAGASKGDPFWENSEKLLLSALILYLWHVYPPKDQTFANVVKLLKMARMDENGNSDSTESPLDILFDDLEKEDPQNLAVQQYHTFKLAEKKTISGILISLGVRLQSFELSDIQYLTNTDDFEFESFADTRQAIFVIIPTADTTFNFIVSMMYSQLFSSLYTYCETRAEYGWQAYIDDLNIIKVAQAESKEDSKNAKQIIADYIKDIKNGTSIKYDEEKSLYRVYTNNGTLVGWRGTKEEALKFQERLKGIKMRQCEARCPNHVRLILDEFANIGQIPDFDQKLATIRKYEISCAIILQAISQLKEIYDKKWNTIAGNCDSKLFLGCDDPETIKWLIEVIGKKTTVVENTSWNSNTQGSTSYNRSSVELLTVDQITMMKDNECIVRIRGEHPYYGLKYELTEHPNYKYAAETKGKFVIPISDEVKKRQKGPLWKRNAEKFTSSVKDNKPAEPENTESKPEDVEAEKTRKEKKHASKNYSGKNGIDKKTAELRKYEKTIDEEPVDNSADIFEAFGTTSQKVSATPPLKLVEETETVLDLETASTNEISYAVSQ